MSATPTPNLPPQDLDAEESVLGAMMLSDTAVSNVTEVIRDPRDFYREAHASIFQAILRLLARSEPIDAVTVADELANEGKLELVGGRGYVHGLVAAVPATANARRYAQIVRDLAVLRRLIDAGLEIAQLGFDRRGEVSDIVDRAEARIFEVAQQRETRDLVPLGSMLQAEFEKIERLHEHGNDVIGVPSGFRDLDRMTSGFHASNLIILAARPAMGKTSLALGMARHVAVEVQRPAVIFSLEMSANEIAQRLMSAQAGIDLFRLRTGKLRDDEWTRLIDACDRLSQAPLYIDDTAGINVMEIRAKTRRLKAREPELGLVVIDYLQLMSSAERVENRVQEISQMSRGLKVMARDLSVPVIALSQLSRAVESRPDKKPLLSDLRESGSIEQDADLVLFVYREEYYKREETPPERLGVAEVIVAKHRNGRVGEIDLAFIADKALFANLAREG